MDSGRDPDDLREPAALPGGGQPLRQARWFRATAVFSLAATMAAFAVPDSARCAADREVVESPPPRAGQVGAFGDVATLGWAGAASDVGAPMPHGAPLDGSTTRVPSIRGASAAAPAAPKSPESGPAKEPKGAARSKAPETTVSAGAGDVYWVQVGAFRDAQTAHRVAQRLREQKYQVRESVTTRQALVPESATAGVGAPAQEERDRYEVVVTGASVSEVEATLTAKGLTSRVAAEGAVITPGLPLGEAVALSKDLSNEGLAVRVRRVGTTTGPGPRSRGSGGGETLHRVRVGAFTDRAAAEAALKELGSRGYQPVLTRGNE